MARTPGQLPNYKWLKFPLSYLQRREFMQLKDEYIGIFIMLYMLAGIADSGGLIADDEKALTIESIAWQLRRDRDVTLIAAAITELLDQGLLRKTNDGFEITNFEIEQGPGLEDERAKWRERQAKSRESRTSKGLEDPELDSDQSKKEKKRKEENRQDKSITVTKGIVTRDKELSSIFSFFEEHLKDHYTESFHELDIPTDEEKEHWVNQFKKHGEKVYIFWQWAWMQNYSGKHAYQIDKKHDKVSSWESDGKNEPKNIKMHFDNEPNGGWIPFTIDGEIQFTDREGLDKIILANGGWYINAEGRKVFS